MEALLIVDVASIASRAFHTSPYTYFSMVWKAVEQVSPTHLGLCFDDNLTDSIRKEWYPAYKANRTRNEGREMFIRQIYSAYNQAGVPTFMAPEGDDMVASLVRLSVLSGFNRTVIFSGDRDMMSLVQRRQEILGIYKDPPPPHVSLLTFVGGERVMFDAPIDVKNFMGISPDLVIDYKALVGDASDNVPGVRGIGPVAAKSILAVGDVESFISNFDPKDKKAANWAATIASQMDDFQLFKRVLSMDNTLLPDDFDIERLTMPNHSMLSKVVQHMKETEAVWMAPK